MPRSNVILTKGVALQTLNATPVELTRITIPINTALFGEIRVGAIGGTAGSETEYYRFKIHAFRLTGNATLRQGVADGTDHEVTAGAGAAITVSGTDLIVTVTGIVGTLNWEGDCDLLSIAAP